ncbi:MAG TPA: RNA polymerase sigma factor [Burkholderiales bacterium]|jgi:RNA polymerase sigma-70 factor (ECF subfamily)|nr:RNA polymerase sigma factor [Burkholderiales bacterium]
MSWNEGSSDEELMLLYREGDAGAFDALYGRHRGGVYRYCLRQCRDAATAEELFQDVWMNLIRARAAYTVQAKFTTYLYRLAHNRLVDHYRQHRPTMVTVDEDDCDVLDSIPDKREQPADVALDVKRQAERLKALIAELPEAQREAFLLQQEGGLTVEQIASATGVTRETAKSRLRYAFAKLREGLAPWR